VTCGRGIGYTCSENPTLTDPGCGEHFGSLRAFDKHLVGAGRKCMSRRQLGARGFRVRTDGAWSDEPPMTAGRQLTFRRKRGRPTKAETEIRGTTRSRRNRRSGTKRRGDDQTPALPVTPQEKRGTE
jgi:hypothetical protein